MGNLNKKIFLMVIAMTLFFALAALASASTTCEREGCDITITINIAFFGATQSQIDDWTDDIEDTWNGNTYGECECNVYYEVNSTTTTNCTQATAAGFHCIMVTAGPARDTSNKTYRGYMYNVSQNGSSTQGWWSSQINQPLPGTPGDIHDAAHEAGHMMGLPDDYNASAGYYGQNIMGRTWGANATPTQEQIDDTVENNCEGEDAECPDECCCGNGKIDEDKGEDCDPMADPTGCEENEFCGLDCKCYFSGWCGDGIISSDEGEECDYNADPTGCKKDEECTKECECKKKPQITGKITDPSNGTIVEEPTDIKTDVESDLDVDKVKFYVNGEHVYTDEKEPYEWEFDPAEYDYEPGEYEIKVRAYDVEGNSATDKITIVIEEAEISIEITEPEHGFIIENKTDVIAEVESTLEIEKVEFYADDELLHTDEESPWQWELNPAEFDDGPHEIRVKAYDEAGNKATDIITVTTFGGGGGA